MGYFCLLLPCVQWWGWAAPSAWPTFLHRTVPIVPMWPPATCRYVEDGDLRFSLPDTWPELPTSDHSKRFYRLLNSAVKALSVSQICTMQWPKKVFETSMPLSMWHLQTNDAKPFHFISHFAFMWWSCYFWSMWKYFRPQNRYKQQDMISCSMVLVFGSIFFP